MQSTFSIPKLKLTLEYKQATVTQSNKYNSGNGYYFAYRFFTHLLHDVVFKTSTGEHYPFTLKNINLPLYTDQAVTLMMIDNKPIGFIDNSTNEYYYLSKDLSDTLGIQISVKWIILAAIGLFVSLFLLLPEDYRSLSAFFLLLSLHFIGYTCACLIIILSAR